MIPALSSVAMRPLLAAVALLAAFGDARADEVVLRNGATLEGEVVEETDERVTLRMEGGRVTFEKKLVASIRKSPVTIPAPVAPAAPGAAAAPGTPSTPGKPPSAAEGLPGPTPPAAEDWCVLWSPEKRVGWLHSQARMTAAGSRFEVALTFLDPDGKVGESRRLYEETGPDLAPRTSFYMESGPSRHLSRTVTVGAGRVVIESVLDGEKSVVDHPLPADFGTLLAVRARVLGGGASGPASWSGTIYDAREGRFERLTIRLLRREKSSRDGTPVDAVVLARERGSVVEEERVGPDGRLLFADLDGARLTAIGTTKERVAAYKAGALPGEADEERRARTGFVSPEDGFRLLKPGASWQVVPADGPGAGRRVLIRDALGVVSVAVETRLLGPGEDPPPAALGAALVASLEGSLDGFERLADGYIEHAGRPAFLLRALAVIDGDPVRLRVITFAHRGRAWTLTATAPRPHWDEALPHLERLLASFEWL